MSRHLLLSCLLMLGSGCATSRSGAESQEPAYLLGQQAGEPLRIRGHSITGPNSSLTLSDNGLRGRYLDQPISVSWTYQLLTGSVGDRAARLELAEGDDIHVEGYFGTVRINYVLNQGWFIGKVGLCDYTLARLEGGFVGRRNCGGPLEPDLKVRFPSHLLQRPVGEQTALLLLALVNTTDTYSPARSMDRLRAPPDGISAPPTVPRFRNR